MTKIRTAKEKIRKSLENRGPEYIPDEFRDSLPDHHLGWLKYDERDPYLMESRLSYGWEPINKSEMALVTSNLEKYEIGTSQVTTQGQYVTKVGKDGVIKYLMKIHKDKWAEILQARHGLADDRESTMQSKMKEISGGESGFEKANSNIQHVFTAFK